VNGCDVFLITLVFRVQCLKLEHHSSVKKKENKQAKESTVDKEAIIVKRKRLLLE
jgi:hypothetical protein